jgi:hypothetical protein
MDRPLQRRPPPHPRRRPALTRLGQRADQPRVPAPLPPTPRAKEPRPDGNVCQPDSKGLLTRRPVTATHITYIGKESNRLEEATAGLLHDLDEILDTYNDPALDPLADPRPADPPQVQPR